MKNIFVYLIISLIFFSCSPEVNCNEIKYIDGISYYNGKLFSGSCIEYYPNGQLRSKQSYLDGKDHGDWMFYFPAEIPRTKGSFNNGTRIGKWEYYYQNGNPWKINYYDSVGNKTGKWTTYNNDKSIDSIVTFN